MKVRKTINFNDLILFEKVKMIYNEKFAGENENKILTEIYNKLNNKFLNLELEEGKEIKDIKYIMIFNFENGKSMEAEMNVYDEILSDYFRGYDSCFEYRYDDVEIINILKKLHQETRIYEDKVATADESDLLSEEY